MVSFQGIETLKPHIFQIIYQLLFAGMNILSRIALIHGMNSFVFVTYRHFIATLAIAPSAYFLERKKRPPLTWPILFQIFFLGTGIAIVQNCFIPGLYYTSSTFGSAAFNLVPVSTFPMAIFLRLETFNIRSLRGQVKILGAVICVGGAMVMTLYNGPALQFSSPAAKTADITYNSKHNNMLGYILVFLSVALWSACITFQAPILKRYPAKLSLTALSSLVATVESALIAVICEHKKSNLWALSWNIELLSVVYSGIMCFGLGMFLQAWCISKKGPVFVAIFSPLSTIVTAILELIILHVNLHVGSVVGGIFIVVGLYSTLWGRANDLETGHADKSEKKTVPQAALESDSGIIRLGCVTTGNEESDKGRRGKANDLETGVADESDKGRRGKANDLETRVVDESDKGRRSKANDLETRVADESDKGRRGKANNLETGVAEEYEIKTVPQATAGSGGAVIRLMA